MHMKDIMMWASRAKSVRCCVRHDQHWIGWFGWLDGRPAGWTDQGIAIRLLTLSIFTYKMTDIQTMVR